jgi:protein-S-isoprenylcysteine O-methyltransferase Ste14
MITSALEIVLLNFIYIGILPRIFFDKKGRYNFQWWLTGGPLFISPIAAILMSFDVIKPMAAPIDLAAVVLSTISIALISFTLGTHRIPLALWHQNNDAPREIVTWGAYRRIRHPFYTSFIISQISAVFLAPHLITLGALLYTVLILTYTAKKEEKKLSASEFGTKYQQYMKETGRFFPKLGMSATQLEGAKP